MSPSLPKRSLAAAGAVIVDADKIAHEIILKGEPAYQEIIEYYGTGILDEEGNIIRKKLGEIVFNDKVDALSEEQLMRIDRFR